MRNINSTIKLIPFSSGTGSPTILIPENACDCHHHIFEPEQFPYRKEDTTDIPTASVSSYQQLQKS